jgi:hypothetical protein
LRTANGGWFIAMPTVLKGSTRRQRGWSRAPVPTWRQGVTEFKPLAQIHQGNGRPLSPRTTLARQSFWIWSATALGLTIPPPILPHADKVIE